MANAKEFTQDVVENMEDAIPVEIEKEKVGIWKRFLALKTWQKVAVVTLLTGAVAGGSFLIWKLIIDKPEVVADAIETVASETAEAVVETI